jgi:hypothetical protein
MARGWESKSVEEQIGEHQNEPASIAGMAKQKADAEATRQRAVQSLELQRERILDQRTSNPHRRAALESALSQIEAQLKALG